jgi:choline kinase
MSSLSASGSLPVLNSLILAAGRGSRLGGLTVERPKPLTKLGGITLIERALAVFEEAKLPLPELVVGYRAECLEFLNRPMIANHEWSETGIFWSLSRASRQLAEDETIIAYGDIFFGAKDLARLANAQGDIVVTYDPNALELWSRRFASPLDDLERFTIGANGNCSAIGGRLRADESIDGQFTGLFKLSPEGWKRISEVVDRELAAVHRTADITSVLALCLRNGVTVKTLPLEQAWGEVDTSSDIELYERMYFGKGNAPD